MEDLQSDQQFEFEDMTLAIVPGSFKPPHKGHWEMVMNYVNKVDKVIVLISNISTRAISSRPLSLSNLRELGKITEYAKTKLAEEVCRSMAVGEGEENGGYTDYPLN